MASTETCTPGRHFWGALSNWPQLICLSLLMGPMPQALLLRARAVLCPSGLQHIRLGGLRHIRLGRLLEEAGAIIDAHRQSTCRCTDPHCLLPAACGSGWVLRRRRLRRRRRRLHCLHSAHAASQLQVSYRADLGLMGSILRGISGAAPA